MIDQESETWVPVFAQLRVGQRDHDVVCNVLDILTSESLWRKNGRLMQGLHQVASLWHDENYM